MGTVRREETILNLTIVGAVSNVLVLHDGANFTFGAWLTRKETVNIVVARRALNKDVLHGEQAFFTGRAVILNSTADLSVFAWFNTSVELSTGVDGVGATSSRSLGKAVIFTGVRSVGTAACINLIWAGERAKVVTWAPLVSWASYTIVRS